MSADNHVYTGDNLLAEACRIFDGPVLSVTPDEHEQRLGTRAWLDWWFAKCDPTWWLDLRALTPNRADTPWTERVRLDDLDTAVKVLMEWNKVRCVYFGVCPRRSDAPKDRRAAGVVAVPGMWCDVDDASPEILSRLRTFPKPPDHIIQSGHGYHGYWRFDEPADPTPALKQRLKVLARVLDTDPAVAELARVMRVPFSWNRKRPPHVQARICP